MNLRRKGGFPRCHLTLVFHRLKCLAADNGSLMVTGAAGFPLPQKPPCLAAIPAQPRASARPKSRALPEEEIIKDGTKVNRLMRFYRYPTRATGCGSITKDPAHKC